MKKIFALTVACTVLAGCSYLGQPEAYTVIDEETAQIPEPVKVEAPAPKPAPVMTPCGGVYCAPAPIKTCGCTQAPCQINPGMKEPLVIQLPGQPIVVQ